MSTFSPTEELTHLRSLVDRWSFSKETAFRLPELLAELRESSDWFELKELKLHRENTGNSNPLNLMFVRRVLLDEKDEAALERWQKDHNQFIPGIPPLLYQWLNSHSFNEIASASEATGQNDHVSLSNATDWMEETRKGASTLIGKLCENPALKSVWEALVRGAFEKEIHTGDDEVRDSLLDLPIHLGVLGKPFKDQSRQEKEVCFRLLNQLYSLYARIRHSGYIEWTLSRVHFFQEDDDCFQAGRPHTLAYILITEECGNPLPDIMLLKRFTADCKVVDVLTPDLTKQREGRFWIDNEILDHKLVEECYLDLFKAFNPYQSENTAGHSRHIYRQIAIPVYTSDRATRQHVQPPQRWTLTTSGTFLGWLLIDVSEELLKQAQDEALNQALYEDLIDIRDLLNPFAEKYLEGEMEWALTAEPSTGTSPIEFVSEQYHHCDGWQGISDNSDVPPASDYFQFLTRNQGDGSWQLVTRENYGIGKNLQPSSIEAIQVALDRDAPSRNQPSKSKIILLKHLTTALPLNYNDLHRYGVQLSGSIRHFYERAGYIRQAKVDATEQAHQDISHEVNHIAMALRGKWTVTPDSELLPPLAEYFGRLGYQQLPEEVIICPEPRIITTASKVIHLWTGSRDPVAFFLQEPDTLTEVMQGIWKVVIDSALGLLTVKKRFDVAASYNQYKAFEKLLDSLFTFDKVFTMTECASSLIPLPRNSNDIQTRTRWLMTIKLLLAKFKDIVRHADPTMNNRVIVSSADGMLSVRIENYDRAIISEPHLKQLYEALGEVGLFKSTSHGRTILERLERESKGFIHTWEPREKSPTGQYSFEVTFNWK